jgi:hypothetical protein
MAKLVGGPLGSYKGKAGGTIGTSWKGIAVIKAMPLSVANPNSVAQQTQRGKFSQCIAAARLLLAELIHAYWDPFAKGMSGFNAFVKKNIDAFNADGLATPTIFSSARGILVGIINPDVTLHVSGDYAMLTWDDNSGVGDALATDILHVAYYNTGKKTWTFSPDNAVRSAGTLNVNDSVWTSGDFIHLYPFFVRPDTSKISDSVHLELEIDT